MISVDEKVIRLDDIGYSFKRYIETSNRENDSGEETRDAKKPDDIVDALLEEALMDTNEWASIMNNKEDI